MPTNPKISTFTKTPYLQKTEEVLELLVQGVNEMPENIEVLVNEAIPLAKHLKDKKYLFFLYIRWGYYWHRLEKYKDAEKFTVFALRVAQKLENNKFLAYSYNNLGLLYLRQNQYHKALQSLFKALSYNSEELQTSIYSNIGTSFFEQQKFDKALEYYQKVLDNSLASNANNIFNAYINIGVALQSLGKYEEAVKHYQKSLQIMGDNERYIDRKAACFENFGETRLIQKQYDEALFYLNKALQFNVKLKQFKRIAVCLRLLGITYFAQKKYDEAYKSLQKSLFYAREHSFVIEEKEALLALIQYHKETKQWESCIAYQDQLIELQAQYFYPEKKEEVQAILDKKEDELDVLMERNLQIEQQNQRLQQYNRELKQYAFIVAHDLKEPLCNISGFTTLLTTKHKENFDEEAREFLKYIEGGAQYMHSLLEDLLQYTTLQFQEEKIVRINTNQHLQKVLTKLQPQIDAINATIQISDLPQIDIEPKHFHWLMLQIIGNALKFSHPDKPCYIFVHSYEKKGKQYIEVRDNGIGIESLQQQKIFRIFQRLHKQNYGGTGIGLAICKKIIDMYSGEIGLHSKVEEGTAFHFSLPTVVVS